MTLVEFLKVGGNFTFPKNKLLKNAEASNKRDMRKKFIKSSYSTMKTNRIINKAADGMKFNNYNAVVTKGPLLNTNMNILTSTSLIDFPDPDQVQLNDFRSFSELTYTPEPTMDYTQYEKYVGFKGFQKAFDEVELEMPEASKYRAVLTKIAEHESKFNYSVQNTAGAPAYGYFLFMLDGKKWNNITKYAGTSIKEFREDPKLQIKAAIKLAQAFESSFKQEDLAKASQLGININGLIGGAWLAGPTGVKRYLNGQGDASDSHWYSDVKAGSRVSQALLRYNV